jgi:hypothetical protein
MQANIKSKPHLHQILINFLDSNSKTTLNHSINYSPLIAQMNLAVSTWELRLEELRLKIRRNG